MAKIPESKTVEEKTPVPSMTRRHLETGFATDEQCVEFLGD